MDKCSLPSVAILIVVDELLYTVQQPEDVKRGSVELEQGVLAAAGVRGPCHGQTQLELLQSLG